MGYTIGSLNCCGLGTARKHDYDVLADIILSERFDIIALQEVYKPEALEPLRLRLLNWEVCHERPATGSFGDYGFSFLWNTKRVKECSRDGRPNTITMRRPNMTRRPLLGRFSPCELHGGLFFEFRFINIHLCWDSEIVKNDKSGEYNCNRSNSRRRRNRCDTNPICRCSPAGRQSSRATDKHSSQFQYQRQK